MENTVNATQQTNQTHAAAVSQQQLQLANARQVQARPVSISQRLNMHYQRLVTNPGDYVLTALASMATFMAVRYAALSVLTLGGITAPIATPIIAGMMAAGLIAMFHATAQEKAKRSERMAIIESDPSLNLTKEELDRAQQLNGVAIVSSGLRHAAVSGVLGSLLGYLFTELFPNLFDKPTSSVTPNDPTAPELPNLDGDTLTFGHDVTETFGDNVNVHAGDGATFTAGDNGTFTVGDNATLNAGDGITIEAQDGAHIEVGDGATINAADNATIIVGDDATITVGDNATITAGNNTTLIVGENATYTLGENCTVLDAQGNVIDGSVAPDATTAQTTTTADHTAPHGTGGRDASSNPSNGTSSQISSHEQFLDDLMEDLNRDPVDGTPNSNNGYNPFRDVGPSQLPEVMQPDFRLHPYEQHLQGIEGKSQLPTFSDRLPSGSLTAVPENDILNQGYESNLQLQNGTQPPGYPGMTGSPDDQLARWNNGTANEPFVVPEELQAQLDLWNNRGAPQETMTIDGVTIPLTQEIIDLPENTPQDATPPLRYNVPAFTPEPIDVEAMINEITDFTNLDGIQTSDAGAKSILAGTPTLSEQMLANTKIDTDLTQQKSWTAEFAEARLKNQIAQVVPVDFAATAQSETYAIGPKRNFTAEALLKSVNADGAMQAATSFMDKIPQQPLAATQAQQAANFIDRIEKMTQLTHTVGASNQR